VTRQADVVVPVYADAGATQACLSSVLEHSGAELGQVIVVDDCSTDPAVRAELDQARASDSRIVVVRNERNLGFVASANRGLALRRRDVVLLNSDTRVTAGWLPELLEAAYAHDRVAAAVPLSNNGTLCSVPEFCVGADAKVLEGAALRLTEAEPRFTELPTGVGFCLLLRHQVLNMIGGLDPVYGRGYNEENDWCVRAQQLGFVVLRANRALVYHLGQVSFGDERSELDLRNARLLNHRYPQYLAQNRDFAEGPEARAAASYVRRRLAKPAACVDVSHLGGARLNGTGVYATELLRALAADGACQVSARVATEEQRSFVEGLGVATHPATAPLTGFQVYHRPSQIFSPEDLGYFLGAPCHTVVSYQDLIAFRAPSVLASFEECARYRAFSYASLQAAQAVVAISEHNRQELLREFHLPPKRVHTVHHGIDADAFQARDERHNREVLARHYVAGPYFLCAGSDYAHKNLKLLVTGYALYRAKAGKAAASLILIGPASHSQGSLFDRTLSWPEGVRYLGELPEHEVRPLFQEARAFVYPTAYEGFGLPALEALACGVPLVASSLTSVPEVAKDAALYLTEFSPDEVAAHLATINTDEGLREKLIAAGLARARQLTWKETARKTAAVYLEAIDRPSAQSMFSRRMLAHLLGLYSTSEARWKALVE
jgi:glycosyltransferase involved in cell wall biosynthesis/GT2 family glycosyltransferase